MRALSEFISSAEGLFSNLQLSLKHLKDGNATSFSLVLKRFFSSGVILCVYIKNYISQISIKSDAKKFKDYQISKIYYCCILL